MLDAMRNDVREKDCIAATEAVIRMWCDGERDGGKRYRVWSAVKEGCVCGRSGVFCRFWRGASVG